MKHLGKISPPDRRTVFGILVLFHFLLLAVILSVCNIKYEVSDDFMMELIVSGAYTGQPDAHMMFSNILWGWCLTVFYRLFPGVSWYFWGQMLVCLLSYIAICYVICQTTKWYTALFSVIGISVFSAMDLYILPQFTKTAAAAVIAGSMLFLWALFNGKSRRCVLLGAVLALTGSLIRMQTIYVAAPSVAVYLVYESARALRSGRWDLKKLLTRVYLPGVGLVVLVCVCALVNHFSYVYDEAYRYYYEYSAARAAIVDFSCPDYSSCAAALEQIGVSENDYNLILNWSYGDPQVFSLETMQQVGAVLEEYRQANPLPLTTVLRQLLSRRPMFYPGALLCVMLGVYCIVLDWKKLWIPGVSAAAIVLIFCYFSSVGRCVYRVEFGSFFCAAVVIACLSSGSLPPIPGVMKWLGAGAAAVCLVLQAGCYLPDTSYEQLDADEYRAYVDDTFYYSWVYDRDKYSKAVCPGQIRPDFIQETLDHPENIYVLDFNTAIQTLYYDFSPMDSAAAVFPKNLHYLGGVAVHHPAVTEPLKELGFDGLLDAMVDERVYFVSNATSDLVLTYLREHGYPQAQCEWYAAIDGYQIWKYSQ